MTKESIQKIINPKTNRLQLSKLTVSLEEAYCIFNSIDEKPLCKCGKYLPFYNFKTGYRKSCGNSACKNKKPKLTPKSINNEIFNEIFSGKGFNCKLGEKYCISQQDCYDFKFSGQKKCTICNKDKKFIDYAIGYRKVCKCKEKIILTKDVIIEKCFNYRKNIKSSFMKKYNTTIQEIYGVYHNIEYPKCKCGKDCHIKTFKDGPLNHCNNPDCRTNAKKDLKPIYGNVKEFIKEELIVNGKLHKKFLNYFENSESCYLSYHNIDVSSKETKCVCGKSKMFKTFKEGYTKTCGDEICINKSIPKRQWIKNTNKLTGKYIEHNFIIDNRLDLEEICDFYNISESTAFNYFRKFNLNYLTINSKINKNERKIAELINNPIINSRQIIKPLELDLYSKEDNFAIEYNGLMWHSYGMSKYSMFNNYKEENKKKHLNKTVLCEEKGIQLYHIFENEWLDYYKKGIWISMIKDKQGFNNKIGARKCTLKEVSTKEAREFINENHMQGYTNARIKIGLYYNNVLYSIMTFSKSGCNKNMEFELVRFCTRKGYTIQGGGSRILNYFEKTYKPKSLLSYANRRWSTGNFYIQLGFTFKENTAPNYFYFHPKENILWGGNKLQKHKLSSVLEKFNTEDTETINMYNNGYRKIYDSGNKVFIKEYK